MTPDAFLSPGGAILFSALFLLELVVLGYLGDRVQGRLLAAVRSSFFGKLLVYPLLAPGVALHEIGHALAALVAGAGIRKMSLFWPRSGPDGRVTLGYVLPRYQPRFPGGQALIALAPLLLPPLLLYALAPALVPVDGFVSPIDIFQAAGSNLARPSVWLWLYLFSSMTLSNFPSDEDFASLGFSRLPLVGLALSLPLLVAVLVPDWLVGVMSVYFAVALFLLPSLLVALAVAVALELGRRRPQST